MFLPLIGALFSQVKGEGVMAVIFMLPLAFFTEGEDLSLYVNFGQANMGIRSAYSQLT